MGSNNRKRRQEEEDAAAEAVAEHLWATESLPPGTSVAAIKAAAGDGRGRPPRISSDDEEPLMPRLPGDLGSAVIQEAAALADVACASAGVLSFNTPTQDHIANGCSSERKRTQLLLLLYVFLLVCFTSNFRLGAILL